MPYRRLPKTDQARLQSLQKAVALNKTMFGNMPISTRLLSQAQVYLPVFTSLVKEYNFTFENQVKDSKVYQQKVRMARMYISHFIQVLNFAVMRGELKKEVKLLYGLEPDDYSVPNLTSEKAITEWGAKIIAGENERIQNKGVPFIYPSVAKLKVYYDIFCDSSVSQKTRQRSTTRNQSRVVQMRQQVDELILRIWDSIEEHYANLLPYERYVACVNCGVIYYYRRNEPELTAKVDEDIRKAEAATLKIDFTSEPQTEE